MWKFLRSSMVVALLPTLSVAAQTFADLPGGISPYGDVYRVEFAAPSDVFVHGLQPAGVNDSVIDAWLGASCDEHAGVTPVGSSIFVMATSDGEAMHRYAARQSTFRSPAEGPTRLAYVYHIRLNQEMYNLQRSVEATEQGQGNAPYLGLHQAVEPELWISHGAIAPEHIVSATAYHSGSLSGQWLNQSPPYEPGYDGRLAVINDRPYVSAEREPIVNMDERILFDASLEDRRDELVLFSLIPLPPTQVASYSGVSYGSNGTQCSKPQVQLSSMKIRQLMALQLFPVLFDDL